MKIFPHILSRVGGLEFKLTEQLAFRDMEYVDVLLEKEKMIDLVKELFIDSFQFWFQQTKSYRFRAILLNSKIDLEKNKFSFLKKLEKNAETEVEAKICKGIKKRIQELQKHIEEYELMKISFDKSFEENGKQQLEFLRGLSLEENFQKGILQSSQSFFQRVQSFQTKPIDSFRKKEFQTARSIAQYFYRITAKTSPFSYFTTLDLLSEKNEVFESPQNDSLNVYLQFNNFLLIEIQNQLLQIPSFFEQMNIELNSTIRLENEAFSFLKNERNIETIQRIEASEVLNLLRNNILTTPTSFKNTIDEFEKIIEADRNDLINYLLEIIETGFLEWKWDVSPLVLSWENLFLIWLKGVDEFEGKNEWVNFLEKLNVWKNDYQNGNSKNRFSIQKELKTEFEKMGILNFPSELILFEDVQQSKKHSISKIEIQPILQSLNVLLNWLDAFAGSEIKVKVLDFWKSNFGDNDSVSLLDFYEKFYQTDFSKIKKSETVPELDIQILEKIIKVENGIVHVSSNDLNNLIEPTQQKSYAGLFQFFKNGNKLNAVINGIAPGYGKLYGRFLPLFEQEVLDDLRLENKHFELLTTCVENTDASIFNANQHPSFFNYEIKSPNGQNQLEPKNQILINDLEVTWDKKIQSPILIIAKNQKPVTIFDFGFEHPSNRSPMYRLLNGFQIQHTTFRIFTKKINALFTKKRAAGIHFFPRIVLDGHLILQREYWEVPVSFFPKKEKNESSSSYFYKIQKWIKTNYLNRYIFIQPIRNSNESSNLKKDFYKPQFFDLESPFSLVLLNRILEKHNGQIKIEAMLPQSSHLVDQKFVREEVIQWKSLAED